MSERNTNQENTSPLPFLISPLVRLLWFKKDYLLWFPVPLGGFGQLRAAKVLSRALPLFPYADLSGTITSYIQKHSSTFHWLVSSGTCDPGGPDWLGKNLAAPPQTSELGSFHPLPYPPPHCEAWAMPELLCFNAPVQVWGRCCFPRNQNWWCSLWSF